MNSIRDLVHQLPETKQELSDYILNNNSHIKELVEKNPDYKSKLEDLISASFDKYSDYMGGIKDKIGGLGHLAGYSADAWLLYSGDIVGALGGKFINLIAQIPDKGYAVWYGVKTGNYLDAAQCLLEGIISYVPGLTFVDQGLTRIVQKRMVSDVVDNFEKEVGIYKPWTTKVAEKLSSFYTDVKDRAINIFSPDYEPA